jgi:hypothetical protein
MSGAGGSNCCHRLDAFNAPGDSFRTWQLPFQRERLMQRAISTGSRLVSRTTLQLL